MDVPIRIFDVAGLAMDAVLDVDDLGFLAVFFDPLIARHFKAA